jgi:glutathionylspermidine synthase
MERRTVEPRPDWRQKIESQGLVYWETDLPDGTIMPYWTDGACYVLSPREVEHIERATNELMQMCVVAGDYMIENEWFARMGIPIWAEGRIRETWESEPPMVYGRFDLAFDGENLKVLEFNADTPTALVESAVCQWFWLEDQFPNRDQFNSLHDALKERWRELRVAGRIPGDEVHFAWTHEEASGEDIMTVGYMMDVAQQAGLICHLLPMEEIGWNDSIGFVDQKGRSIRTCFKLYPWEWMVHESYGARCMNRMGTGPGETQWIEPIWKMLWSNKALLVALWECFPEHPYLVPAHFAEDAPADLTEYVVKPLLAREGANAKIVASGTGVVDEGPDQGYGQEGYVVQKYVPLPVFPYDGPGALGTGTRPVVGSWVVDMYANGIGIRESDSLITNNLSRFVPHLIESGRRTCARASRRGRPRGPARRSRRSRRRGSGPSRSTPRRQGW